MSPWFKGFKGTIDELDDAKYIVNGEISEISDTKVEITELPVRTWTQDYKEKVQKKSLVAYLLQSVSSSNGLFCYSHRRWRPT